MPDGGKSPPSKGARNPASGSIAYTGDYLNREYLNPDSEKQWEAALRPRASISDIEVAGHLGTVAGRFGGRLNIQFSQDLNTSFLKQGNLILLGSRRSNPWVELYEPSLNFRLEVDPHSTLPSFRNRVPQSNEAPSYAIPTMTSGSGDDNKQYIGYGLEALLKSCGSHQLTVIIEELNAHHFVGSFTIATCCSSRQT